MHRCFVYFQGAGTNESTLIEILCTRNNRQIQEIKSTYKASKLLESTNVKKLYRNSCFAKVVLHSFD